MFAVEKHYVLHIVSVCVALVCQRAMRMRYIVICVLSLSSIFFHIVLKTARF